MIRGNNSMGSMQRRLWRLLVDITLHGFGLIIFYGPGLKMDSMKKSWGLTNYNGNPDNADREGSSVIGLFPNVIHCCQEMIVINDVGGIISMQTSKGDINANIEK